MAVAKRTRMIRTIDFYILRKVLVLAGAMTGIALFALLLERLLRLLDLAARPNQVLVYVSQMLVTLIPHYLAIALPAAFFLAVLMTFGRLQRDNEIAVLTASGLGLHRLMAPVLALGVILVVIAGLIAGYLQPFGRYAYRSLVHAVEHASLSAAINEGTFVHVGDMTFFADRFSQSSGGLANVFVHEEREDQSFTTTATMGTLRGAVGGPGSILTLRDGTRVGFHADGRIDRAVAFGEFRWPIGTDSETGFRSRGKDERELTLPELWEARDSPPRKATVAEVTAEFHARLARAATIIVLPLLAVPLALLGGRGSQTFGVAAGVTVLVVFEESLRFGEALTSLGRAPAWLGVWLPFLTLLAISLLLSFRAVFRIPRQPLDRGLFESLAHGLRLTGLLKPKSRPT